MLHADVDLQDLPKPPPAAYRLWGWTWLLAVSLFGLAIVSEESLWRRLGYRQTIRDSKNLWYFWRQRVYSDDGRVIVSLGTSRITADLSLEAIGEVRPEYRPVQLGLSGSKSCIGLLKDLVADERFKGVIVCELDVPLLDKKLWDAHTDYSDYRPTSWHWHLETLGHAAVDNWCVGRQHSLSCRQIANRVFGDNPRPEPRKYCRTFRREVHWDFAFLRDLDEEMDEGVARYREKYKNHVFPDWETLSTDIAEINDLVRTFQARGGEVVFLRAPSSGRRWELEEQAHSKTKYWDRFAATSSAICIHFRDVPDMRGLHCPDGSHLDYRDAPNFTKALVGELTRRGVFDGPI